MAARPRPAPALSRPPWRGRAAQRRGADCCGTARRAGHGAAGAAAVTTAAGRPRPHGAQRGHQGVGRPRARLDRRARAAAAALYRELYERAPNVEYRRAFERLTGTTLALGPPLPPVPAAATVGSVDVDDLLHQVEPLVGARAPRSVARKAV